MKKGKTLIKRLPEVYQELLLEELYDNLDLNGRWKSLMHMLYSSFIWSRSIMGHEFWEGIANQCFDENL